MLPRTIRLLIGLLILALPMPGAASVRAQGTAIEPLRLDLGAVASGGLAWSPDGLRLAVGVAGASVQVWDVDAAERIAVLEPPPGTRVQQLAWQPGGALIAAAAWARGAGGQRVFAWDAASGEIVEIARLESVVHALAWSPDGARLAYTVDDRRTHGTTTPGFAAVWDADRHETRMIAETERLGAAWSPGGDELALGLPDSRVEVRDAQTFEIARMLRGNQGWPMFTVAWNPGGTTILGSEGERDDSNRCGATLWDADSGEALAQFPCLWLPAWSSDGRWLAGVWAPDDLGGGSWLAVFPPEDMTGAGVPRLVGADDLISALAWSPTGERIAAADHSGAALVWTWEA